LEIRSRDNVAEDSDAPTRPDTLGTRVWWLLSQETVGATGIVLNVGDMPPRTAHQLHRHAHAEQAILVIAGRGLHLRAGRDPVEVAAGSAVFIPIGEWHGFANPYDEVVTIASVYGGVGRRQDAGYELHPGPAFDFGAYLGAAERRDERPSRSPLR
jgi:quercetin dioxygenase-like cupin family protein